MHSPVKGLCTITLKVLLTSLLILFGNTLLRAQMIDKIGVRDYNLNPEHTEELRLEFDNISFFKNNEFSGPVMKGYSLPGLWISPKVTYQPLNNIKLELGGYAMWYSGAYKFPNYAYIDISQWKGSQFQQGAHILPYFRGQLALNNFNFVLGNLYGASTHRLIKPLYDPELALTADPESGFQILYDLPRFHLDTWINWQSFIFDLDTHQEAFIFGVASEYQFKEDEAFSQPYLKVQGIVQHRGGEQDNTTNVSTLMNASIGVGMKWNYDYPVVKSLNVEADLLGYYQQAGTLWPYSKGGAFYANASMNLGKYFFVEAGYFVARRFISVLGNPYFGSVSTKNEDAVFDGYPQTWNFAVDYTRSFGKGYAFGAKAEAYFSTPGDMTKADGSVVYNNQHLAFTLGVYMRLSPSFLLKILKK